MNRCGYVQFISCTRQSLHWQSTRSNVYFGKIPTTGPSVFWTAERTDESPFGPSTRSRLIHFLSSVPDTDDSSHGRLTRLIFYTYNCNPRTLMVLMACRSLIRNPRSIAITRKPSGARSSTFRERTAKVT